MCLNCQVGSRERKGERGGKEGVHTKFRRTMPMGAVCSVVLMGDGASSRGAAGMG
jgi:hypothetical protein